MRVNRVRVGEVLHLERREISIEPTYEYSLIGVYSFGKGIFHREPMAGADLGNYRFFAVQPGDLVLTLGAGTVNRVSEQLLGLLNEKTLSATDKQG